MRLWRVLGGHLRLIAGVVCGIVAFPLFPPPLGSETRTVLSWDVGVLIFLVLSAVLFGTEREGRMRADSERQEEGEWTVFAITVLAIGISFAAVVMEFSGTHDMPPERKNLHVAFVAVTLLLSWLMAHTVFAFRYAHEYYSGAAGSAKVDGGLEFPGDEKPDYLDFLYFSLVLGMTFQVSDVQITSRKLRRLATLQGFLSFVFNTIILALTVNIASGLL